MLNEPVRGSLPGPSFFSLSGLEQLRAFQQGLVPRSPYARLMGYRMTQLSAGNAVFSHPISPWFDISDGFVDLSALAELGIFAAALTTVPPGSYARSVNMSLRYLRACTIEDETVIIRSRVLHGGASFTTVETVIEDALGRAVAHATGSVVISSIEPSPPPLLRPLEQIEEPVYATPDPHARPLKAPLREMRSVSTNEAPPIGSPNDRGRLPPFGEFLGMELLELSEGRAVATMPTSEWHCALHREVAAGLLVTMCGAVGTCMHATFVADNQRLVILNQSVTFVRPVAPDGRQLVATTTRRETKNDIVITDFESSDADGQLILSGQVTGLLVDRRGRSPKQAAERLLLSVLFTDVVGSTTQAQTLGDSRWRELLDEHNTLVRRQLEAHKGKEIKTIGDGFLATFDSPTRAVQCARAIREGLASLGLEIRGGIHTGECDLIGGDVAGVAVHVASRVQSAAQPGEILVSSTVRDLVSGSELQLLDRGVHELKGLDGKWVLLAVE